MIESSRAHRLHIAAFGLWIGVLFTAGLTAAIAFPVMKRLAPVLPGFPGAPETDHWSIAAGHIAHPVLTFAVWTQLVLALCAVVTAWMERRGPGWVARARFGCAIAGLVCAVCLIVMVERFMSPAIAEYWRAAAAGDAIGARVHKAQFDVAHPYSSRMMSATLVAASIGLVLAVLPRGARTP